MRSAARTPSMTRVDYSVDGAPTNGPQVHSRAEWEGMMVKPNPALVFFHNGDVGKVVKLHQSRETKELDFEIEALCGADAGENVTRQARQGRLRRCGLDSRPLGLA